MGVITGCAPRDEVLKRDLDDAIFAADFGQVVAGTAPKVYADAATFFQNTHPATQLCSIVRDVFGRLADKTEPGATIRLSTGFGGGKTHTLMAFWHLAHSIENPAMGADLLPAAGRPAAVTVVGVDASAAGVPVFSRHGKLQAHSLWGEIAYQLGGQQALADMADVDSAEQHPDEARLEALFPRKGPVLILLDEIVIYMAALSEQGKGNVLAFLTKLMGVVGRRPQTVLVVTDPADQAAYAQESARLDIIGRRVSSYDPIGAEAAKIITRRLFRSIDPAAAQKASAAYSALYRRVLEEHPGALPPSASSADYAKKIVDCYPFHPRLLDTAQGRLGALQEFNKSRGVLRLFARIIRSVWAAKQDIDLITAGDLDWSDPSIQGDLLARLHRENFRAAVVSDIEGHAAELDGGSRGVHVRAASALLLESIPLQPSSGLDAAETALSVLRPADAGSEAGEALNRLAGVCWHTYPLSGGRGWQFRYEPNILKQIEERKGKMPREDAEERVKAEAQSYFGGMTFSLAPWPSAPNQVPDQAKLQLALCEDEAVARDVCRYADTRQAPMPRRFQNAIVAVTAQPQDLAKAVDNAQRLSAAEAIERENRTGETGKLVREQMKLVMPKLQRDFRIQTCRAFARVVLPRSGTLSLDEQFQGSEEQILKKPQGQGNLRSFLESKHLMYGEGDALDADRFVKEILLKAVAVAGQPALRSTRAILERFYEAEKVRIIPSTDLVRRTVFLAVAKGQVVLRMESGTAYDQAGAVSGAAGHRARRAGEKPATLPFDDGTMVAPADCAETADWLQESAKAGASREAKGPTAQDAAAPPQTAYFERSEIVGQAEARALLNLKLVATRPADATALMGLVPAIGASRVVVDIAVDGELKDGGSANFALNGVRPNHAIKPLSIAQTIYNAVSSESSSYQAAFALDFGQAGRDGLKEPLESLMRDAPDQVMFEARFAPAAGPA